MADKEKKVKKKKKEGEASSEASAEASPAAVATPAEPATPKSESTRQSSRTSGGSKRSKRAVSNVFSLFSQRQVAEFKEGFQLMDCDKDGVIGKNDLRSTFDSVGKLASDKELDDMLAEAPGPITFTQLLTLFAGRMAQSGASDDDEVVINAFKAFDVEGKIDGDRMRNALMSYCDVFTAKETDDAMDQMVIDDKGFIDTQALIAMLIGKEEEEES